MTASPQHNIGQWPFDWASKRPTALAWADDHRRCTYATAADRIARLVDWLERAGLKKGDRIALWLTNRGATLEVVFAAARLGAIALPINARLTPAEVAFQLDDAEPRILLSEAGRQDEVARAFALLAKPVPVNLRVGLRSDGNPEDAYERALAAATPSDRCEDVPADAPVILMYTSGTTGKPKGALLPHRKATYNSLNATEFFGIREEDRVLVVAPLFHSLGLQILSLPAIHGGAGLVIQEGFDATRVWEAIECEGITYFGGVPTMHQRLYDALEESDRQVPGRLRFAFTAGAAAPAELIRAFDRRGLLMKQGYGQTETSILTCLDTEDALRKAGSVGRPVGHAEIRLIDPATLEGDVAQWRDVPVGAIGEIVVRGPINMLGYWRRPEATAETLRGPWLRTGDLATRDDDFDVTLVGRAREMFISGGENVYPAEIEAALMAHPEIAEAAVVAISDSEWGEVGRAYLVAADGYTPSESEVASWLADRLARFKQPRSIVFETELPRTASGKVQKHRLGIQTE